MNDLETIRRVNSLTELANTKRRALALNRPRGRVKEIPLTRGKVAVVDLEDFEKVRGHKWYASTQRRRFYAGTKIRKPDGSQKTLYMHRLLLPDSEQVDHINGDGLDNRRENLRPANSVENHRAFVRPRISKTSTYRGVSWNSRDQKWRAQIQVSRKVIFLGRFASEKEAAGVYDKAAGRFFGEFASLNFP